MEEGPENAILMLLKPYVQNLVEEAVTNTMNTYFAVNGIDQHIVKVLKQQVEQQLRDSATYAQGYAQANAKMQQMPQGLSKQGITNSLLGKFFK